MKHLKLSFAAAAMLLTTACAGGNEPLSPLHGAAVDTNIKAMALDIPAAEGNPSPDARVIDGAIDRYQQDNVKRPSGIGSFGEEGAAEGDG